MDNINCQWPKLWTYIDDLYSLQAVFEGVIGSGFRSDIAIDDVKITNGACAGNGNCNFEKNTCIWSNTMGDDFDWLRKKGRTQSQFTGPSTDHTTGDITGMCR